MYLASMLGIELSTFRCAIEYCFFLLFLHNHANFCKKKHTKKKKPVFKNVIYFDWSNKNKEDTFKGR